MYSTKLFVILFSLFYTHLAGLWNGILWCKCICNKQDILYIVILPLEITIFLFRFIILKRGAKIFIISVLGYYYVTCGPCIASKLSDNYSYLFVYCKWTYVLDMPFVKSFLRKYYFYNYLPLPQHSVLEHQIEENLFSSFLYQFM